MLGEDVVSELSLERVFGQFEDYKVRIGEHIGGIRLRVRSGKPCTLETLLKAVRYAVAFANAEVNKDGAPPCSPRRHALFIQRVSDCLSRLPDVPFDSYIQRY